MEESSTRRSDAISTLIGWCILLTSAGFVPVIFAGLKLAHARPEAAGALAWMGLPSVLLSLFGGILLVTHRRVGAYFVYLATILTSFGAMNVPFIPFANRLLDIGPYKADALLALNYLLVGVLAWDHWRSFEESEPKQARTGRGLIVGLVAISLVCAAYMRSRVEHLDGQAPQLAVLPYIGMLAAPLDSATPVAYRGVYTKGQEGLTMVFSGRTTEANLQVFAAAHNLRTVGADAAERFLTQPKQWKLDEQRFPRSFAAEDLRFIGRLNNYPKLVCQIAFSKADGRFTAHVIGVLRPAANEAQSMASVNKRLGASRRSSTWVSANATLARRLGAFLPSTPRSFSALRSLPPLWR